MATSLGPARIVMPGGATERGYVTIDADRITAVGPAPMPGADVETPDGTWLAPGFVDLHVHGGAAATFMDADVDMVRRAADFHAHHGTTSMLATTWAAERTALRRAVEVVVSAAAPNVVGIHLEGPFLSQARRGAQPAAHVRDPDRAELAELLEAGSGAIRSMTLAPERPGAGALIDDLNRAGALAAIGHTDATYDETIAAIDRGARHATHLCNGMRPLHHREPGPIAAFLERGDASVEVIPDGRHVVPSALRLIHRAKGAGRVVLVTDALGVAGLGSGHHRVGDWEVRVVDDTVELADGSALVGSALTMAAAARRAMQHLGVSLPEAVRMASEVPATVAGLVRKGVIAPGADADLVVLDDDGRVKRTMLVGRWLKTKD